MIASPDMRNVNNKTLSERVITDKPEYTWEHVSVILK